MHMFGDVVAYTKPGPKGIAVMNALVFRAQKVAKTPKPEDAENLVEELSLLYMHPDSNNTAGSGNLKQFADIDFGVRESEGEGKLGWSDPVAVPAAPTDAPAAGTEMALESDLASATALVAELEDKLRSAEQENSDLHSKLAEMEAQAANPPAGPSGEHDGGSGADPSTDQH